MLLPELRAALRSAAKNIREGFGTEPVTLGLEEKAVTDFELIQAGWYARNGYQGIASVLFGGAPTWSGEPISTDTALNLSTVWACYRIISETIGFMPLVMMQKKGDEKQDATDKPMYSALKNAPNDEITAQGFTETHTGHCVMEGNAYAQIVRRSGTNVAVELRGIPPECVRPSREKTGQKRLVYLVKEGNEPEKTYTVQAGKPQDIFHLRGLGWDGIRGYSVVTMARQSMGTVKATERNVARFYANGGRVPYLLEMAHNFKNDQEFDKFRADWEKTYAEPHKAPILENGLTYKQIGLNAADAQMLETRQFSVPEICRWFSVSPHLVADLSRATFSNIEQLALEFVQRTLMAWLTRWEQELWRCVLTPEEKSQGYFFRHNVNALLRGDFQSRMQGYSTMLQNGIASVNEVRDLEDWNPIDGGDDHHIQLNMQSLPGSSPLPSQLVKLGGKTKAGEAAA